MEDTAENRLQDQLGSLESNEDKRRATDHPPELCRSKRIGLLSECNATGSLLPGNFTLGTLSHTTDKVWIKRLGLIDASQEPLHVLIADSVVLWRVVVWLIA